MSDSETPEKKSFLKNVLVGTGRFIKIAWTIPAVKSLLMTNLIRLGVSGTVIAVAVALGDAYSTGGL